MDLRQLGALVAVADHRSFSAAARSLHTVQSNVSTHIARLERELGSPVAYFSYPYGHQHQITEENRKLVQDHADIVQMFA